MTKVKMPEPVAWRTRPFDYGIGHEEVYALTTQKELADSWIRKGWSVEPKLTTTQAEAYANARVKQALEEAANICWEMQSADEFGKDDKDRWVAIAEQRIWSLIPKEDR